MKVGATLENELAKTIVSQGAWAALFIWLLIETRKESRLREEKLQNVISKNQEVISELATKFNVCGVSSNMSNIEIEKYS